MLLNTIGITLMLMGLTSLVLIFSPQTSENIQSAFFNWKHRSYKLSRFSAMRGIIRAILFFLKIAVPEHFSFKKKLPRLLLLSTALLIGSLATSGFLEGKAFGIGITPWNAYSQYFEDAKERFTKSESDDFEEEKAELLEKLEEFSSLKWKLLYSVLSVIVVVGMSLIGDYISFSLSRSFLKGLLDLKSATTLSISLIGLISVLLSIAALVLMLVSSATSPLVLSPFLLTSVLFDSSFIAGGTGILGTLVLSALLADLWIWAVVASAILPGSVAAIGCFLSVLSIPIVQPLGRIFGGIIERIVENRFGATTCLIAILGGVGLILSGIICLIPA